MADEIVTDEYRLWHCESIWQQHRNLEAQLLSLHGGMKVGAPDVK
jgi:hypothetical protein